MDFLFKSLGLDNKEKQIYMKLLSLGSCPISLLSQKIGMPRSSLYVVIERLEKLEVIEVFQNHGKTFIRASEPHKLRTLLEKKSQRIKNAMEELEENLPLFEAALNKESIAPKVNFYEGSAKLKKLHKIWSNSTNYRSFFDMSVMNKYLPHHWENSRSELKKGEFIKEILFKSPESEAYKKKPHDSNHEIKILNKPGGVKADMMIFEDKIYLTSYLEKEIVGVTEISNQPIATYMSVFFDELWERLN